MDRVPAPLKRVLVLTEVGRWRLSKALGVPGLERIGWGCICWALLAFAAGLQALLVWADVLQPTAPDGAVEAWLNWVYLAVMVISAVLSYAMRPKPPQQQPPTRESPEVEDGTAIREIFGTVWIDNPAELLWRALPEIPIRRKQGKK